MVRKDVEQLFGTSKNREEKVVLWMRRSQAVGQSLQKEHSDQSEIGI